MKETPIPLFSEGDIAARVTALAAAIASADPKPDIAAPILIGGYVFAADLLRALSRHGLDLHVDILWLRSYGKNRESGGTVSMILGPNEAARGKNVLVIDGVLDHGRTLMKARELYLAAGAATVTTSSPSTRAARTRCCARISLPSRESPASSSATAWTMRETDVGCLISAMA